MKGMWSAGAYVDESLPWWPSKLFGVNMGPTWMRVKTDNGAYVNALISYLGEPYDKEGDLAMIPIAWGYEHNGKWQNLLGYGYGSPYIQTDKEIDNYFEEMSQVESNLANNLERKMHVREIVWVSAKGLQGEGLIRGAWQIGEGQKWWYEHVGGPARWWSRLSATERESIKDQIRDPEGKKVIAIAFYLGIIEDKDGNLKPALRGGGWLPALVDLYEGHWQLEK